MMNGQNDKANLRKLFMALRRLVPPNERQEADQKITDTIIGLRAWKDAAVACLYMSALGEVDTKFLFEAARAAGKQVVFPRVEKEALVLHATASVTDFTKGKYGILEPKKSCKKISPDVVDVFIVPGTVFDVHGHRLGQGKGYYDKLLTSTDAHKIGLAYDVQVIAEVPHSSHDVPMTLVVTESRVYEN